MGFCNTLTRDIGLLEFDTGHGTKLRGHGHFYEFDMGHGIWQPGPLRIEYGALGVKCGAL